MNITFILYAHDYFIMYVMSYIFCLLFTLIHSVYAYMRIHTI